MKAVAILAAAMATCFASGANAQAREEYFGRYDTECPTPVTTADTGMSWGEKPTPADRASAKLVTTFVAAAGKNEAVGEYLDRARIPDPTLQSCTAAIIALRGARGCKQDVPYILGDGEILVGWTCRKYIAYSMYFTVAEGKISNIWANDDTKPVVVLAAPGN